MPEIRSATSIEIPKLKCLIYGAPGTGKTVSAATLPGKKLFLDFDKGILSLRGREDVSFVQFEDLKDFRQLEIPDDIDCLVLDGITTFEVMAMDYVLALNKKEDQVFITQAEWGHTMRISDEVFASLYRLPIHFVAIAHHQTEKDEMTGRMLGMPLCIGRKRPAQLPIYFDEVYHSYVEEMKDGKRKYLWQTQPDRMFYAKTRLGLPPIVEQDFGKVLAGEYQSK